VILDLIGATSGLAYMALIALGLHRSRRTSPLPDIERAIALFMLAALAQLVSAAVALMRVDKYGWAPVGIQVFLLAACVVAIHLTVKRADRMEGVR
jgi:hypothetical protein